MMFGLSSILSLGKLQMLQSTANQLTSGLLGMFTNQMMMTASVDKMMMEASAGIGSAYAGGANSVYGAIFAVNNEVGNVLKKAGGR